MKVFKPEDYVYYEKRLKQLDKRIEITDGILSLLRRIFYTPLGIFFHLISFVFRIVGAITSLLLIVGIYFGYKAFTAWKAGSDFTNDLKIAAMLIIFPFIAYAIAFIAEKAWGYFEDNAY